MSRRTLILLPIAVFAVMQAWLLPRTSIGEFERGRMIAAFVAVGVFCGSWLLDGDPPARD